MVSDSLARGSGVARTWFWNRTDPSRTEFRLFHQRHGRLWITLNRLFNTYITPRRRREHAPDLAGEVELRVIESEGKYRLQKDEQVMRRRRAISPEETECLLWPDEEAREAVVSSDPPVHEGQGVYTHGQAETAAPHEKKGGKGRGGRHRTGPIWGRRLKQRSTRRVN